MTSDADLKALFERAAEIAKAVPSALQQAAFNRALDALLPKQSGPGAATPADAGPSRGKRRKAGKRQPSGTAAAASGAVGKKQKARATSGRTGPKAALEALLSSPFWGQPRTIGELRDHLRTAKGHTYKLGDLSPALVRLLREGKIQRSKNSDKQYEYKRT